MSSMLELKGVTKSFGSFTAIQDLDLHISEGGIFGLLGPNGAGKTTLLRMATGLMQPSSGRLTLFGDLNITQPQVRKKIGYMPQQLAVYPGLSVLENILFYGRLYRVPEAALKENAQEILRMVELEERGNDQVAHLSGGMVRRVMLATALIHRPVLVILDEPTAGVDPALRLKFWDWFERLAADGTSILITTHHISEASRCHEVVFLREGKLLEQGSPQNLMQKYHTEDLEAAFVKATE